MKTPSDERSELGLARCCRSVGHRVRSANLLDLFPSFSASELKCVFAYRNVLRHQVPWPLARSWSGGDCLGERPVNGCHAAEGCGRGNRDTGPSTSTRTLRQVRQMPIWGLLLLRFIGSGTSQGGAAAHPALPQITGLASALRGAGLSPAGLSDRRQVSRLARRGRLLGLEVQSAATVAAA
jgi:hypothetical protein